MTFSTKTPRTLLGVALPSMQGEGVAPSRVGIALPGEGVALPSRREGVVPLGEGSHVPLGRDSCTLPEQGVVHRRAVGCVGGSKSALGGVVAMRAGKRPAQERMCTQK